MNSSSEIKAEAASRTNWERLDAFIEDEIDMSDSPRRAVKIELELDPKVLAWFQAQGQDYERRMRMALRLYAEAHDAA